jgi:hypothetical protein
MSSENDQAALRRKLLAAIGTDRPTIVGGNMWQTHTVTMTTEGPQEAPEEEKLEPVEINDTVEVHDSRHQFVGYAVYDPETKVLSYYMSQGENLTEINTEVLSYELARGHHRIQLRKVATVEYDPMQQNTCEWYTPDAESASVYDSRTGRNYEYDRPHSRSVCSNPEIIRLSGMPNPECRRVANMTSCEQYTAGVPLEIERVQITQKDESVHFLTMSKKRRGVNAADDILVQFDDEQVAELNSWNYDNLGQQATEAAELFQLKLDAAEAETFIEIDTVNPDVDEEPKEKAEFFDFVLNHA